LSLAGVLLAAAVSLVMASAASAAPATPFNQCPAVGLNTSCRVLIVINPGGGLSFFEDPAQSPTYDGDDDTLVGVVNNSGVVVQSIALSSQTVPIFGFDGDGLCSQTPAPPNCPPNGFGPTDYEGPNVTFTVTDANSGFVNFTGGLAPGATAYFGLEDQVAVSDLQPPLTTAVSSGTTSVGGSGVTDTATLTGTTNATGNITFSVYGPDDPTCSGEPFFLSSAGVAGNGVYTSGTWFPNLAGTYTFVARYSGDANNQPLTSACADPLETVVASPKLTTLASQSATAGQTIHDTATLSGGRNPTGQITFSLYGPDDADCSHRAIFIVDAAVYAGNGTYSSQEFVTSAAGTYRWIAHYEGDANNPPVETACNDPQESVVVGSGAAPTPPIVVVPAHSTSHARFKVAYARYVRARAGRNAYLLVRVNSRRAKHVRLRIQLSAPHWTGQRVTQTIRTNRAVKLRGLHLIGTKRVKVTILG